MKILFCSGEAFPYSKSGGLADVAAALPKALKKLGHDVKIITPFYRDVKKHKEEMTYLGEAVIQMGDISKNALFYEITHHDIKYIFIENDELYDRERYYGFDDDQLRFTFFNFAIFEYIKINNDYPDIIHANDWQTGLIPFFLDIKYKKQSKLFENIKTLLSIHNLEKQGSYPMETEKLFGHKNFTYIHLGRINFLKCGIMRANAINTVSENYRNEILTKFYGFTLDGALKSRELDLYGILNGLDQELYNPEKSNDIYQKYNESNYMIGKKINKKHLIKDLNLSGEDKPLISFINRLARQKGIDILMPVLDELLQTESFNFVALGYGDPLYEKFFIELQNKYPKHVYFKDTFDNELSQKIYAASDLFILPSLFEPCGLNQMIAMRYGSLPIVRETGGLKDTVTSYNKFTNVGVGFSFKNYDSDELKDAINQALTLFHEDKESFESLIKQAMNVNHSLSKMAKKYEDLYDKILNNS
jgi:starch synthase